MERIAGEGEKFDLPNKTVVKVRGSNNIHSYSEKMCDLQSNLSWITFIIQLINIAPDCKLRDRRPLRHPPGPNVRL